MIRLLLKEQSELGLHCFFSRYTPITRGAMGKRIEFHYNILNIIWLYYSNAKRKKLTLISSSLQIPLNNVIVQNCSKKYWTMFGTSHCELNSFTTEKQTTKFLSANFQKMLSPCYIILRIQRQEDKQYRSRWGGSSWATSSRSLLFANSAIFISGSQRVNSLVLSYSRGQQVNLCYQTSISLIFCYCSDSFSTSNQIDTYKRSI